MPPTHDSRVIAVLEKLRDQIGCAECQMEVPQFSSYSVGHYYGPHLDYEVKEPQPAWGTRMMSVVLYLNDDFSGGHTRFTEIDVNVVPETGKLLFWRNYDDTIRNPPLQMLEQTRHESTAVTAGTKCVIVTWIRESALIPNKCAFELKGQPTLDIKSLGTPPSAPPKKTTMPVTSPPLTLLKAARHASNSRLLDEAPNRRPNKLKIKEPSPRQDEHRPCPSTELSWKPSNRAHSRISLRRRPTPSGHACGVM